MATDILIKRSTTTGAVPTTSDLSTGELAINTVDKRLFTNNSGTIVEIGTAPTSLAVTGNTTVGGTLGVTGNTTLSTVSTSGAATLASGSVTGNFSVAGTLTVATPSNSTDAASKGYVDTAVANVIDSAPGALDTLNELAAAINDDASFATTITNALAGKLALAGGTMTGDITLGANKITSTATPATDDTLTRKGYVDSILGSATAAATSATAAASSATDAANSASAASTSASNASTSETNAATSASNASTSASNASTSASAASSSATSASNSATAAATSASNASTSEANAASSYDSFDDRYLGAKASDPSVDNDGDALITGALYFNTTANQMKVYNGSIWDTVSLAELIDDTTPQLGGNLDTNGNDITFGDSDELVLGSNRMRLYYDPNNFYTVLDSNGTSGFRVLASNNFSIDSSTGTSLASFGEGYGVNLSGADGTVRLKVSNSAIEAEDDVHLKDDVKLKFGLFGTDLQLYHDSATTTNKLVGDVEVTGDLKFGDNDKAIFGAGSDLQIYHDGSSSRIHDFGTGDLIIAGQANILLNALSGENYIRATENGAVTLYYDNAAKLATTNTGIDVTGTVTADGLSQSNTDGAAGLILNRNFSGDVVGYTNTPDINFTMTDTATSNQVVASITPQAIAGTGDAFGGRFRISTANSSGTEVLRLSVDESGDISFYEDTGTTPKLFWDASAERLGIRTSSPFSTLTSSNSGALTLDSNDDDHSGFGLFLTPSAFSTDTVNTAIGFGNTSGRKYAAIGMQTYGDADQNGLNFYVQSTSTGSGASLTEAMRIDSSGAIGINSTSPSSAAGKVHVVNGSDADVVLRVDGADTTSEYIALGVNGGNGIITAGGVGSTNNGLVFKTAPSGSETEAARIDSSGNLLVGKTSSSVSTVGAELTPSGTVRGTVDGGTCAFFNRKTSDGTIVDFRKDGSTVGSISAKSGDLAIGTGDTGLRFFDGSDLIWAVDSTTGASRDDSIDLGASNVRFDDIYATNGTIQTSDRNEKQDIEELSEAEQRVAVAAKGLLRKFRWIKRVEEKGDDARIHFGIIAQDLQAAFEAEGLDAGRYAMFIHSTWTDEETGEERSRMGVRYSELLAFIISAI